MYGMYGKMGAGYPLKIPYIIGHTVHRQGHFLRRQAAGNDRLRESRGNGWHTTLVQSLVCYTHHDGGREKSRTGGGQFVILTGPKKKNDR